MPARHLIAGLLLALLGVTGVAAWAGAWPGPGGAAPGSWWWRVGVYGVPLALAGMLLTRQRWTLMAAVIYGTIGLAFDIATVLQVPREADAGAVLAAGTARGLCHLAVLIVGWGGFLRDWPAPSSSA